MHLAVTLVAEEEDLVVEAVVAEEATVVEEAMEVVEADEAVADTIRVTVVEEEDTVVEEDLVEAVVVVATSLCTSIHLQQRPYTGHCARVQCLS